MVVDQNPCCRRPPPVLQTFVAGPLLQTLVADLCVEYCSLQGACSGGVWREMAAQACYKANVFDSLLYGTPAKVTLVWKPASGQELQSMWSMDPGLRQGSGPRV